MRLLLLALALGSAAPALAQTTDYRSYWPLTPGNTWVYVITYSSGNLQGGSTSVAGSTVWTALDSVTVAAGRLPRVRINGGATPVECLVSFEPQAGGGVFVLLREAGDDVCDVHTPMTWDPPSVGFLRPGFSVYEAAVSVHPVAIGGVDYGARRTSYGVSDDGGGGISNGWAWGAADSLGLIAYEQVSRALGGFESATRSALRWAYVDGQTYGQPLASRPEFMPFDDGNVWQFALTDASGASFGTVEWAVTAPTSVRLRHYVDDAVVSNVTCPLTITAASGATGWQTRLALACTLPEPALFPSLTSTDAGYWVDTVAEGVPVVIGAETVVASVADGGSYHRGAASGGAGEASATWRVAEGIGVVRYTVGRRFAGAPALNRVAQLAYARVGGVEYGAAIVAGEAGTPTAPELALRVAPNPASGAATMQVTLPEASTARATVVDALGRTVATLDLGVRPAGVSTGRLDVRRLAPGVYTVRLTAGDAVATTRVSVVR